MSFYHVTQKTNLQRIFDAGGLTPSIGPRSIEAGENEPLVFAFANRESLEDSNWIWECFDDDEELAIIEIQADCPLFEAATDGAGYEVRSRKPVGLEYLLSVEDPDTGQMWESLRQVVAAGGISEPTEQNKKPTKKPSLGL